MTSKTDPEMTRDARAGRNERAAGRLRADKAAGEGAHLPTTKELLLGCQFLGKDIRLDAAAFAERLMVRVDTSTDAGRCVHAALSTLTASPDIAAFELAATAIRGAVDVGIGMDCGIDAEAVLDRLDYYAANLGSSAACVRVAQCALDFANGDDVEIDEVSLLTESAIGWLASARSAAPFTLRGRDRMSRWNEHRLAASRDGDRLVKSILRYHELLGDDAIAGGIEALLADAEDPKTTGTTVRRAGTRDAARVLDVDLDLEEIHERFEASRAPGVIAVREVGMPDTSEGKRVVEALKGVINTRLPFVLAPNNEGIAAIATDLVAEFPHASHVVSAIMGDLRASEPVRIRPTILVGEPGCGKTTFARRLLAKLLGSPPELYPCGGIADASVAGAARRWSTGEPSLPLALIRRHKIVNVGIILDEVEKAATSRHNGSLLDALIGMLEPASASVWHDPWVQAAVNIGHVCWVGTANTTNEIPAVLRDRCRIIKVPNAGPEHLPTLANSLLKSAIAERGLLECWALPLDGAELVALSECWSGGSIRKLGRLVQGVLAARDQYQVPS